MTSEREHRFPLSSPHILETSWRSGLVAAIDRDQDRHENDKSSRESGRQSISVSIWTKPSEGLHGEGHWRHRIGDSGFRAGVQHGPRGTGVARRDLQRGAEEAGSDPDDAARSPEITRCIVVAN